MRAEARLSAAIELLDQWLQSMSAGRAPADILVGNFFRARRYAGSKDRREISSLFYGVLRDLSVLRQLHMTDADGQMSNGPMSARGLLIAYLVKNNPDDLSLFGLDSPYSPDALADDEQQMKERFQSITLSDATVLNIPSHYLEGLEQRFGDDLRDEVAALNEQSTLTVRVNPLKSNRKKIFGQLVGQGLRLTKTALSPYGLVFDKKQPLGTIDAYKKGLIEVQDEAAQLASMLVNASADDHVIDLCAGAGGKSLMIAALAGGCKTTAFDIDGRRLGDLQKRAERAGVDIHQIKLPLTGARRVSKLVPYTASADHVVVDVPCSGTGTWRRSPDLRWRMDKNSLDELKGTQQALLSEASKLVKTEGLVYYMTCSLLPQENEEIVDQFLADNPDFERIDAQARLSGLLEDDVTLRCPHSGNDKDILLSPKSHNTDGFYMAVLRYKG